MERKNRGERLQTSADANKVEPFLFLLPDGEFSLTPDLEARTSITDRFLSNFHKPLQRRMLFTKPDAVMPETGVMKHQLTNQVYLVGQDRYDTDGTNVYEAMRVLHLASSNASGRVEVFGYEPSAVEGSHELVRTSLGHHYVALEYQGNKSKNDTDNEVYERMWFHAPASLYQNLNRLCEFELNGVKWSVMTAYYDSGFCVGMVIDIDRDIKTYNLVKPTKGYDPSTGQNDLLTDAVLTPFSASLSDASGESSDDDSEVLTTIYAKALPLSPKELQGAIVQTPDNELFRVISSVKNHRAQDTEIVMTKVISR